MASLLKLLKESSDVAACKLLANGALRTEDLNVSDPDGNGLLHCAVSRNNMAIVLGLICSKVRVDQANIKGFTALRMAVRQDNLELSELLLSAKANVNLVDRLGDSPFVSACKRGNKVMAETLLSAGANLNALGRADETPLHVALLYCKKDPIDVIRLLLERGADRTVKLPDGRTPMDIAVMTKRSQAVLDLLQPPTTNTEPIPTKERMEAMSVSELDDLAARLGQALADTMEQKKKATEDLEQCTICMTCKKEIVFVPCGHRVTCKGCAERFTTCPICRKPIAQKMNLFDG